MAYARFSTAIRRWTRSCATLDAEKESVAKKRGDVFVNMEDIRARRDSHGRFNHPGDLGMNLIAERFWQHIEQRVRENRR